MILKQSRPFQRGMTMMEVLISIVVFAFGLLGIAGLIVVGIKASYSSQQRTTATQMAYDLMDRMRSNNIGASAGSYNKPASSSTATAYTTQKSACVGQPVSGSLTAAGCSSSDMASEDLYEWENALKAALGSTAAGIVCIDSSSNPGSYDGTTITPNCDGLGPAYVVKIYWLDERGQSQAAIPQYQSFVTRFLP